MLRHRLALAAAATAMVALSGCGSTDSPSAAGTTSPSHGGPATVTVSDGLARQLANAHEATAKYANSVSAAERDGYMIITPMMPGMGFHYLNPTIQGFDVTKPAILVYLKQGTESQLVALEWVFPEKPATAPIEGATYGEFKAACHYKDGTFAFTPAEKDCPKKSAESGSPFNFWHPDLVTLHVWLWYHNPAGLYHGTNPVVEPFNA